MSLRRLNILSWVLSTGLWLLAVSSFSQNAFSSEDDLKKQANKLFEEEDFAKAYPLFSQLLSVYSKDPQYNYKFGTCLLFSSNDKEKAIAYLEYAAKKQKQDVDKEVFFYLGKAYHLNYRFSDAIKNYTTYKEMVSSKQAEKYDVDRQIEMCESGKNLLKNVTELGVLEKKEVPIADFFRSYNLSEFNAKLIIKPDELKTSYDKKKKDESLMYLSPDRNQIYYSSYGEDGKNGRDIYYVTRSPEGELSKPIRVSDVINTKYDDDFPFLHPNGKTLYFCSKGHNSMGGYDIFRSEWNNTAKSWGKPVNMDFAINTPDDDILFISDAEDKSAYFSSKRECAEGRINVYRIKLERKPLNLAIIRGVLTKNTGDKVPKATITVTKVLTNEVIGIFNTNVTDGTYTLHLPNGGKFMFSVESEEFKKTSELVVIPTQQEIKAIKQEIELVNENGQDKVLIRNEFDSPVDSTDLQLAIKYIKAKASLEVSPEEEKIASATVDENDSTLKGKDNIKNSIQGKSQKNIAPVTNKDIIDIAYQDAKETQKDANELRKNSESAQQLSKYKNELSIQKNSEAQEQMKSAETMTNQEEKMAQADKATNLRKEAETLSKESALSLTLANQMDELANAKQQQADAELRYAKDLDNAIRSGANEKKMNELLARKEELDKTGETLSATFPPDMSNQINEKQAEASKSMAKYVDIQQDIEDLQGEAKRLRSEGDKAKNESVKQNLNQQAEEMEKESERKKKEAETYSVSAKQKQSEVDSLKNNASLTSSVFKQILNLPETTSTSSHTSSNTNISAAVSNETTATTSTKSINQPADTSKHKAQFENTSGTVSTPQPITSPYEGDFLNQTQVAEKKTSEVEKQEVLAVVYQAWTDSLDKQISSLNKQLVSAVTTENKTQLQNKIQELQSSAEEKRQKAADSRNKVDNLKLQAALAEASTVSPKTTAVATNTTTAVNPASLNSSQETSSEESVSPENLKGIENINTYYISKLKDNEKIANEYEKKSKDQELYQGWSFSLDDESQRLRKDGEVEKADEAEKKSKAKQILAVQTAGEVTQIKTEHPELVASAHISTTKTKNDVLSDKTKTESSAPPSKTTPAISAETAAPVTNTTTLTNPIQSETTSATELHGINTSTPSTSSSQPANINAEAPPAETDQETNKSSSVIIPESLKNKKEYAHYVALNTESDQAKNNAKKQFKLADDIQKISDQEFRESQNISQQMSETETLNERQKLKEKSETLDRRALKNQAKADSIKSIAKNSEAEANSKRTESDLYLQSLDKAAYEEIAAATENKTTTETKVLNTPTSETKTETSNQTASTPSISVSGEPNTEATTIIPHPSNGETVKSSSNPVTKVKSEKAQTEIQTYQSETRNGITETISHPIKNEASANKIESSSPPFQPFTPIPNSFTPFPSPAKSSLEILKYYDALFDKLEFEGSAYSASKPIPVNPPMPEGLVFKVQIGAFKNPIPQDLFKGIKPITAETTPRGLMRYTAGLFTKFTSANDAKNQVNNLGYRDAFVVAFFNGKRIPMNEALAKANLAGENITISSAINSSAKESTTLIPASKNANSTSPGVSSASATHLAEATDVKSISGLFYTIQIGVFSKPVNAAQLYNISPLNSEKTDNGFIRYTTGRFDDESKALRAKNNISQKGITDAFVIAYRDGIRISLTSAKSIITTQGKEVLSKDKQEYTMVPSDTTASESSGKSLTTATTLGIVFKVQVGAFREQVPINVANKLIANSGRGIKTFKDENGLLIYTVGEFTEYEPANTLKKQLVADGLSDAFVIAFKNGKKITASAALDLINNR